MRTEQEKKAGKIAHEKKYSAMCKKYGVKWDRESPHLVGETAETLAKKYTQDKNLNNVPLARWDRLADAMVARMGRTTLAERVCMSKHAAVEMLKRENLIKEEE